MKKFVKPLVIAASVAAVAGIGAVSFAKWEAGANTSGTASGTLGSITTGAGFDTALTATMGTDKLMPYDQGTVGENQVDVWSVQLPTVTAVAASKLQVKLTTDPSLHADSGIYVKYSTTDVTEAPDDKTGYQKLTTTAADLTGATIAANSQGAATGYLVVILDSGKLADMTKNFSITVEVVAA